MFLNVLFWSFFVNIWKIDYIYYWIFHSMRRIDEKRFVHLLCAKHNNRAPTHTFSTRYEIHWSYLLPYWPPFCLLSKTTVTTEIWNLIQSSSSPPSHPWKCNDKWNPTGNPNNNRKCVTISRKIYAFFSSFSR